MGFYTTRYVRASSEADAEINALAKLRQDRSLNLLRPDQSLLRKQAKVIFEEIVPVKRKTFRYANKGATWYPMNEDENTL